MNRISVIESPEVSVPVYDMKDGDIAIIVRWGGMNEYCGRVIQRFDDILITLGAPSGQHFSNICDESKPNYRVRILLPGTKFIINPNS